jgi:hypothetical protein
VNILIYILAGIGAWFVISVLVLTIFAHIGRRVEERQALYLVEDPNAPDDHGPAFQSRAPTNGGE